MICKEMDAIPNNQEAKYCDPKLNPHYEDLYFSEQNGQEESRYIFIEGNELPDRIRDRSSFHIGETGFGTGLNFLTLLSALGGQKKENLRLRYTSLEKFPLSPKRLTELTSSFAAVLQPCYALFLEYWNTLYPELESGWNRRLWHFPSGEVDFQLFVGDAADWSKEEGRPDVDAWFLDGHSPDKNPGIWSEEVMAAVYRNTALGGTFASFTAAGVVKRALRSAGFFVRRKRGFAKKRHMIVGLKS